MRIGVLTGGGDCPGLNAVIRAIVRNGELTYGDELIGFLDAWDGVLERRTMALDVQSLRGMLSQGGTLLGTRPGSPFDVDGGPERVRQTFEDLGLDALIVVGGNGSLTVACRLHDLLDLPIVGVPKTIDNDIIGTDVTFGFHTAVQIATDAMDRLQTTGESHDRVTVVEVMGRHAGWIATYAGIAGGATVILVPELPFDVQEVCTILGHRHQRGRYVSIIVVAEGALPKPGTLPAPERRVDRYGHEKAGGIAHLIAGAIEECTGLDTRVLLLGHLQSGGMPCAYDRVLSTRYGLAAVDAVHDKAWGEMVVYREMRIERAPLRLTLGRTRTLDLALYRDVASVFFG